MADLDKHLERAEKYVSKGKLGAAIQEYKSAYEIVPQNLNLLRTVADLCTREGRRDEAVRYYGDLFDKYAEKNDATKGIPLFRKSLHDTPQPAERHASLARLLQRAKKDSDALAAYRKALELYGQSGNGQGVLECLERIADLDPENPEIQVELGEHANSMGNSEVAARAYLRAGQLLRTDNLDQAIDYLTRAHEFQPDRGTALNLAQAHLDREHSQEAADLLMPLYAESQEDPIVLETLASALLGVKNLAQAEDVLEVFYKTKPDTYEKLFALADLYCKENEAEKGVELLARIKERLFAAKRQKDFVTHLDDVFQANEKVIPLAEFAAAIFNELNKETRYGRVLESLFTLYCEGERYGQAADTLERLVDIDPYDFEHQRRLQTLKGNLDNKRLRSISSRLTSAATVPGQAPAAGLGDEEEEVDIGKMDPARRRALLDDMIVQTEIFLQYSLKSKAVEKLAKIYQAFPGEEAKNDRLFKLYELAQYFPDGFKHPGEAVGIPPAATSPPAAAPPPAAPPEPAQAETHSDLAKISEITHIIYRQTTAKTVMHTAVSELGKYLRSSRCLGATGRPGRPPSTAVEYCSPGVPQSPGPAVMKLLGMLAEVNLDPETGAVLDVNLSPDLKQVGAQALLAMPVMNKESHEQEGVIVLSQADRTRQWKPNEVYLLKAVADQVGTALSHTKLRTLMKRLSVDDASGVLSRSSYLDCLVNEATRSKSQGTPMTVVLLELDKGRQLLGQVGDAAMRRFMQQVAESIISHVRQSDLTFRYTGTTLAVLMGDTTADKVKPVVEKLRATMAKLALPGNKDSVSFSAGVSEAVIRPDYDPVDIVTDVVNRAEFSSEAARKKGNAVVIQ
jgi:diguanylate cyclase (GGDEF)-like protein